jgi:hypothetical protein
MGGMGGMGGKGPKGWGKRKIKRKIKIRSGRKRGGARGDGLI